MDVTNGSGALQEKVHYDAFGNMTVTPEAGGGSLAVGDVTWTGQSWDSTISMFDMHRREYDPSMQQFLQQDAMGFSAGDPNLRRYVGNAPTDATDPSGLFPFTQPLSSNTPKQSDGTYDRAAVAAYQQSSNWQGGDLSARDPDGLYLATLFNANNAQAFQSLYMEFENNGASYGFTEGQVQALTQAVYSAYATYCMLSDAARLGGGLSEAGFQQLSELQQYVAQLWAVALDGRRIQQAQIADRVAAPSRSVAAFLDSIVGLTPIGPIVGATQAVVGTDILGNPISDTDRAIRGAFAVIPLASKGVTMLRRAGTAAAERTALQVVGQSSCFAAGTPLLTPTGDKLIEEFKVGDQILSRAEDNIDGDVEVKVVEETFVRTAAVMTLRVGGRTIRTTAEHPFFVRGKAWQCARKSAWGICFRRTMGNGRGWKCSPSWTMLGQFTICA